MSPYVWRPGEGPEGGSVGGAERDALELMRRDFATVRHVKPAASRQESVESYVLATGFRGDRPEE